MLDKPLRPIWLSQDSRMWLNAMADHTDLPFTPLYLVSASKSAPHRQSIGVLDPLILTLTEAMHKHNLILKGSLGLIAS